MDLPAERGCAEDDYGFCEIAMAIFKQYQIVELANDLPEQGVTRGTQGTILEVYDAPGETEAYEIEVADEAGRSIAQFVATPGQLRPSSAAAKRSA